MTENDETTSLKVSKDFAFWLLEKNVGCYLKYNKSNVDIFSVIFISNTLLKSFLGVSTVRIKSRFLVYPVAISSITNKQISIDLEIVLEYGVEAWLMKDEEDYIWQKH